MTSNSPGRCARRGTARCAQALVVAVLVFLAAVPAAAQTDGAALMSEGNALFRSGLYREALVRYREANAAGLDSGLLQYNLGVTYYKLQQYPEAELWLERASHDATLAPLAAYNLGLSYRAGRRRARGGALVRHRRDVRRRRRATRAREARSVDSARTAAGCRPHGHRVRRLGTAAIRPWESCVFWPTRRMAKPTTRTAAPQSRMSTLHSRANRSSLQRR